MKILIDKEVLEQALEALQMRCGSFANERQRLIPELQAAIEQAAADLDKSSAALINCHYRYEDAVAVNKVLVEAFGTFFPKNACLSNDNAHDDIVITVDVTLGELRKAYSALKLAGDIK